MAKAKEAEAKPSEDGAPADGGGAPKKKFSKKMLMIAAGAAVALLGGLGTAGYLFFMGGDSEPAAHADAHGDEHGKKDQAKEAEAKDGHGKDSHGKDSHSKDSHGKGDSYGTAHGGAHGQPVYYDIPAILVNLKSAEKQSFLKLAVSLELKDPDAAKALEGLLPRVIDQFQTYLRELRVEDLSGSEGTFRLKEELLRRVNGAIAPVRVETVLFKEMIVQ